MPVSRIIAIASFIALIIVLALYALGFPIETPYVPYAMVGLFVIGMVSGVMQAGQQRTFDDSLREFAEQERERFIDALLQKQKEKNVSGPFIRKVEDSVHSDDQD